MDYVHKLMQQMLSVTVGKMAKIAWGNVSGTCFTNMLAMVGVIQHFQKLRETVQKYQFVSF